MSIQSLATDPELLAQCTHIRSIPPRGLIINLHLPNFLPTSRTSFRTLAALGSNPDLFICFVTEATAAASDPSSGTCHSSPFFIFAAFSLQLLWSVPLVVHATVAHELEV